MREGVVYEGKEKRRSVRLYEKIPTEIIFFSDMIFSELPKKSGGMILNISALGVCLELEMIEEALKEALLLGLIKIALRFDLPDRGEIKALGKLAWLHRKLSEESGYVGGMEFLDITTSSQDQVKEYIINSYLQSSK